MAYRDDACAAVIQGLETIGIEFFIHVPDSFGAPVIAHFENKPNVTWISHLGLDRSGIYRQLPTVTRCFISNS